MLKEWRDEEQGRLATEKASLLTQRDRLVKRKQRGLELYLDQRILDEDYFALSAEISLELPSIESKLAELDTDKPSLIPTARKVTEVARRAPALYVAQNQTEKRELLGLVFSNLSLGRVSASAVRISPWSVLAECRKREEWGE